MSQVKNLRAMFENKGDDPAPPDRGRSPRSSRPVSQASDSPRPLSKVRTNFVAIEKDGRMGLYRNNNHELSPLRQRLGPDVDSESVSNVLEDGLQRTPRKLFDNELKTEPIAVVDIPAAAHAQTNTSMEQPHEDVTEALQETPTTLRQTTDSSSRLERAVKTPAKSTSERTTQPLSTEKAQPTHSTTTTTKSFTTIASTKPPSKAASTSTISNATTKKSGTRQDEKARDRVTARSHTRAAPVPRPTRQVVPKKPLPIKTSQEHGSGLVKPKVKSPTKPVNLPASLMAPTASSVSKGAKAKHNENLQIHNTTVRAPSRTSVATATGTSSSRIVRRQGSSINRPRPSLGPPPKQNPQDHHIAKKIGHLDEAFLARLMRPTQASSSKTSDKAPVTPPRKTSAHPSTSNGTVSSSRSASSTKRQYLTSSTTKQPSSGSMEEETSLLFGNAISVDTNLSLSEKGTLTPGEHPLLPIPDIKHAGIEPPRKNQNSSSNSEHQEVLGPIPNEAKVDCVTPTRLEAVKTTNAEEATASPDLPENNDTSNREHGTQSEISGSSTAPATMEPTPEFPTITSVSESNGTIRESTASPMVPSDGPEPVDDVPSAESAMETPDISPVEDQVERPSIHPTDLGLSNTNTVLERSVSGVADGSNTGTTVLESPLMAEKVSENPVVAASGEFVSQDVHAESTASEPVSEALISNDNQETTPHVNSNQDPLEPGTPIRDQEDSGRA